MQALPQKLNLKGDEGEKLRKRLHGRAERIVRAARRLHGGLDPYPLTFPGLWARLTASLLISYQIKRESLLMNCDYECFGDTHVQSTAGAYPFKAGASVCYSVIYEFYLD